MPDPVAPAIPAAATPPAVSAPPALAPDAPSDAQISNDVGNFLASRPLNPNPPAQPPAQPVVPTVASLTPPELRAPTPAPAAPAAPVIPAAPAGLSPDLLRAAAPSAAAAAAAGEAAPAEPGEATPAGDGDGDLLAGAPPEALQAGAPQNAWTKIKRETKQQKLEIARLTAELTAAKAQAQATPQTDPKVTQELEVLRKQVADYENEIGRIEITRSKSFQDRYDAPVLRARAKAARNLSTLTDQPVEETLKVVQQLEQAGSLAEAKQMLSGESPDVRAAALLALTEIREAAEVRAKAIEDWRNTQPLIETEADRASEGELLRQVVDSTAEAVKVLSRPPEEQGKGSWIYMDVADDVEWAARKQGLLSSARAILRDAGVVPTPELTEVVLEGVAARVYRDFGQQQFQRAQELQAALDRRNRAMPRLNGGETGERGASPHQPLEVKPLDPEVKLTSMLSDFRAKNGGR